MEWEPDTAPDSAAVEARLKGIARFTLRNNIGSIRRTHLGKLGVDLPIRRLLRGREERTSCGTTPGAMLQLGDERAVGADLSRDFAAVGDLRVLTPCNAAAEDNARNPRDHDPKQAPLKRSHRVHLSRAPGSRFTMVTAFGFQSIAEAVIRGLWWHGIAALSRVDSAWQAFGQALPRRDETVYLYLRRPSPLKGDLDPSGPKAANGNSRSRMEYAEVSNRRD
jgi:hypothetical protein